MNKKNKFFNAQQLVGHFLFGETTLIKYEKQLRKMLNGN